MTATQIQLLIRLDPQRGLQITGPIHDKILCFGLLEMAKDAVRDYKPAGLITPGMALQILPPKPAGEGN